MIKLEPLSEEDKKYDIKVLKILADNYAEDFRIKEMRKIQTILKTQIALIDFSYMFRNLERNDDLLF